MDRERDKYSLINFEETELCLGLPGSGNKGRVINTYNDEEANEIPLKSTNCFINGKRGRFSETHVDLKLNLSSNNDKELGLNNNNNINEVDDDKAKNMDSVKPPASKAQVVGWPPVRSFRKNIVAVQKNNKDHEQVDPKVSSTSTPALVKVSMDGAPYLRKVDLKLYKSYQELSDALGKLFSSFTSGNCGSQQIGKDFMKDSKLKDILNGSEYVATFEDKDGDWMLVGDVPWEMFVESCKRLQIMKGSEAIGLAPRAMEKLLMKNRI